MNTTLSNAGISEIEYKKILRNVHYPKEKAESLYDYINENAQFILSSMKDTYKEEININFINPKNITGNDRFILNASAGLKKNGEYLIVIYPKLINELYRHATFVTSYSKIFKSIERDQSSIHKIADTLLFIWADFIFFHEYSHIVLDHLNLSFVKATELHELDDNKIKSEQLDNLRLELFRTIEAEADSQAAKFAFGRFQLYKDNIYKQFDVKCNNDEKYYDYALAINFLFEWFDYKSHENMKKRIHPLPRERVHVFNHFIKRTAYKLKINSQVLNIAVDKAYIQHQDSLKTTIDELQEIMKLNLEFMENTGGFVTHYIEPNRNILINTKSNFN